MLEEHFSTKGSTAEDATFDKILTADLSRQARHLLTIVSMDALQYYNRVNHAIAPLVWLALIQQIGPIVVVLSYLQIMRFFQQTGFGESASCLDGSKRDKYFIRLGKYKRGSPPL